MDQGILQKKRADGRQEESIEFFCKFLTADCDKISIENPVNIISGEYVKTWFPDIAKKIWITNKTYTNNTTLLFWEQRQKKDLFMAKRIASIDSY